MTCNKKGLEEQVGVLTKVVEVLDKTVEKLNKRQIEFSEKIQNIENERGRDKQRIADLELTLSTKEAGRRDYDLLAVKLMKEVTGRKRGMDYRDVRSLFCFKSDTEAYRLMQRAITDYPEYIEEREIKNSNRHKKILCPR